MYSVTLLYMLVWSIASVHVYSPWTDLRNVIIGIVGRVSVCMCWHTCIKMYWSVRESSLYGHRDNTSKCEYFLTLQQSMSLNMWYKCCYRLSEMVALETLVWIRTMSINRDEIIDILIWTSMASVCIDTRHKEIVEVLQCSHHFMILQIDQGETGEKLQLHLYSLKMHNSYTLGF